MNIIINPKKCEYLPEDKLPLLVLGTKIDYNFKNEKDWKYISHQTAGHACHQHYLKARTLTPSDQFLSLMIELDRHYLNTDMGLGTTSLDEILEYRSKLKRLGLDCNHSYNKLEEGLYPIDIKPEYINIITKEDLPLNLSDLIDFKSNGLLPLPSFTFYILGNNCD